MAAGQTLAIVGCGNMGSAILNGVLDAMSHGGPEASMPISRIIASTRSKASADKLREKFAKYSSIVEFHHGDNVSAIAQADAVMLGCKPFLVQAVLKEEGLANALSGKFVISIIAGKTIEALTQYIADAQGHDKVDVVVARAIPNVAASVRESMTVVEIPPDCPSQYSDLTEWIFNQIGQVKYLSADLFDLGAMLLATPAIFSVAVDGILDGCVAEGLRRPEATDMVAQCLMGLAQMLKAGEHPAILRETTASPRGCTIQGLLTLEKAGVRNAFAESIINGTKHLHNLQK